MPFLMIRNDITKVKADAIVNPANRYLRQGSGTSRAIYQAAGEQELTEACWAIGYCRRGSAVCTPAFHLPAKYIFHATCPRWYDGFSGEAELLAGAYRAALELTEEYHCESIAFPLLSSGNYGYPKEKAFRIAVDTITAYLAEHDDLTVYLVLYDRDSLAVSQKLTASVEEYIDDHYVAHKDESYWPGRRYAAPAEEPDRLRRLLEEAAPPPQMNVTAAPLPDAAPAPVPPAPTMAPPEPPPLLTPTVPPPAVTPPPAPALLTPTVPSPVPAMAPRPVARSLESLMQNLGESFTARLMRLIDERGMKDSTVYKQANISRQHFSKIRSNPDYNPNKKTVLAFAVSLQLSEDETIDLLRSAGYAFSDGSKRDWIVRYCLEHKIYNINRVNTLLFEYDQEQLGA